MGEPVEVVPGEEECRLRCFEDRVVALVRDRGMGGPAAKAQMQPDHAAMAEPRRQPGRLAHHQGADPSQHARRRHDPRRAGAADLLARGEHELEAGPPARPSRRAAGRHHHRRHASLHVGRTAPEQPVAVALAGERVAAPRRLAQRHDVEMPRQAEGRRVRIGPRQPRHEVWPAGRQVDQPHGEPGLLQHAGEQRDRRRLVAGRIDRVDPHEPPRQLDRLRDTHASNSSTSAGTSSEAGPSRRSRNAGLVADGSRLSSIVRRAPAAAAASTNPAAG